MYVRISAGAKMIPILNDPELVAAREDHLHGAPTR